MENEMNQPPQPEAQPQGPVQPGGGGGRNNRRRRRRRGKKQAGANNGQPQQQMHRQQQGHRQPGQNQGGARRRNRTGRGRRGPAAFVGPMDHSYRNGQDNLGNVADSADQHRFRRGAPNGSYNGQRFPQPDLSPATIREDAPTRIFCFIEDLFFLAKIQETARKLGVKVEFVKTAEPILERASEDVPEADRPALVIIDLNNNNIKPLTLIPKLRSKLKKSTSIIGFLSHIQGELKVKAQEAGCDTVMPRSAFSQNLPNLLRRHAEEEDPYDHQQPV